MHAAHKPANSNNVEHALVVCHDYKRCVLWEFIVNFVAASIARDVKDTKQHGVHYIYCKFVASVAAKF